MKLIATKSRNQGQVITFKIEQITYCALGNHLPVTHEAKSQSMAFGGTWIETHRLIVSRLLDVCRDLKVSRTGVTFVFTSELRLQWRINIKPTKKPLQPQLNISLSRGQSAPGPRSKAPFSVSRPHTAPQRGDMLLIIKAVAGGTGRLNFL